MHTTHHLAVFSLVLETIRQLRSIVAKIERRDRSLADQVRRACQSLALNTAEAGGAKRGNRRNRLESALGSGRETLAGLAIAEAFGYVTSDELVTVNRDLDRICARLFGLLRNA